MSAKYGVPSIENFSSTKNISVGSNQYMSLTSRMGAAKNSNDLFTGKSALMSGRLSAAPIVMMAAGDVP